jgi:hypothetical protein
VVKKIEPTKNTSPSTTAPTSSTNPGNGPTKKHVEPTAKRTPIHHVSRRGAHQTLAAPADALTAERGA